MMQPYGSGMNRKGFSAQGMAGSVAGGGMRSNGNAPAMATPGFNPQASMPVPVVGKWRGYGQMLSSSGPTDAWSIAQGRGPSRPPVDNSLGSTVGQFQDFAREGVVDVVQQDVIVPGITRWLQMGPLLDSWGRKASPHHYGTLFGNYASAHLGPALPNFLFVEWDEATTPALSSNTERHQLFLTASVAATMVSAKRLLMRRVFLPSV